MKKVLYVFLIFGTALFAKTGIENTEANQTAVIQEAKAEKSASASRGDIKIIEASENIRFLSQKIVKDYLLYYINQDKTELKRELLKATEGLGNSLRTIATTTSNRDTKDIIEFLAYSKDQIDDTLKSDADDEKAALMLDYSETLLEGADSIAKTHAYAFSKEEEMLMVTKKVEYLLERTTKYYIALNAGFDTVTNKEQMLDSIANLDKALQELSRYKYSGDMKLIEHKLESSWNVSKIFLNRHETLFIPVLMFSSVGQMEDLVKQLTLFHTQNL